MTSEWRIDINPGYRTKTIKVGNATIEINRPILDAKEQARREKQVRDALIHFGRSMTKHE